MAKITVEFDTVEKTLAVAVDGKAVADVAEVHLCRGYSDDDCYGCSLTTVKRNDEDGLVEMTRLVATDSDEGKALRASTNESKDLPCFLVAEPKSKAQGDIEKFFAVE